MTYKFRSARHIVATLALTSIVVGSSARGQSAADAISAERKAEEEQVVEQIRRTSGSENTDAPAPDPRSEANAAEALKRRAGEQVGNVPLGRAVILGMHVQELGKGRVHVIEVAAATPAFRAGVQKGDEIISYGDFRADSYRGWIDGMRKMTTDAPDGSTIAVLVRRNGKRVPIDILVPPAALRSPRDIADEFATIEKMEAQIIQGPPTGLTTDNDIAVTGVFNQFFQQGRGNPSERAMAQIIRLVEPPPPATATTSAEPETANNSATPVGTRSNVAVEAPRPPVTAGTRIGLAGFRNDQNGMLVMLDIGALEPGNYLVGIDDAAVVFPSGTTGVEQNKPTLNEQSPAPERPITVPAPPPGTAPSPPARQPLPGASTPQSSLPRRSRDTIPPTILAQVLDAAPLPGPVSRPPATPIKQSPVGTPASPVQGVAPTLNQIGTLTVDNSGTGRMQQLVEGVQVRDVIGLALVIYSQPKADQTTLPANLDPTLDPVPQGRGQPNPAGPQEKTAAPAVQPSTPVAGGVIRLISDRRPIGTEQIGAREQLPPVPAAELPTAQRADEAAPPR
jgi:hypothetical protein